MSLAAVPEPRNRQERRSVSLSQLRSLPPTLTAEEAGAFWSLSAWSVYEATKRGDVPVEPIRIGRSLRWATAAVLRSIGIDPVEVLATEGE